jgi:hypothetical protein
MHDTHVHMIEDEETKGEQEDGAKRPSTDEDHFHLNPSYLLSYFYDSHQLLIESR